MLTEQPSYLPTEQRVTMQITPKMYFFYVGVVAFSHYTAIPTENEPHLARRTGILVGLQCKIRYDMIYLTVIG